jgi:hypothetical protein
MAAGYVYVLVNSSMPGLVKVGKTTRPPSDRAQELSSPTGVATPFVVAFEQLFSDVDKAERRIHAELEQHGLRETRNREFFRAASSQVVRIILGVAADLPNEETTCPSDPVLEPWNEMLESAAAHLEGEGDSFQDPDEAIRLYKAAARMGSPEACRELGSIYLYGEYVQENHRLALEWFKEGTERGDYVCYMSMARIFLRHEQTVNAVKAFRKFFQAYREHLQRNPLIEGSFTYEIEQYLHMCLDYNLAIEFPDFIDQARSAILARVEPRLLDELSGNERRELTKVRNTLREPARIFRRPQLLSRVRS